MSNILTDNTRTRRLAASVLAGVVYFVKSVFRV